VIARWAAGPRVLTTLVHPSRNTSTRLGPFLRCANDTVVGGAPVGVVANVRGWALRAKCQDKATRVNSDEKNIKINVLILFQRVY
jgi:hypothetical protein